MQYLLKREANTIVILDHPSGARMAYLDDGSDAIQPDAMRDPDIFADDRADWTVEQSEAAILADIAAVGLDVDTIRMIDALPGR